MPVPSHPMGRFLWDSHRNDIPMDKPRVVHGTYLSVPIPPHSNLCLSHPIPWGCFPWDSHSHEQACLFENYSLILINCEQLKKQFTKICFHLSNDLETSYTGWLKQNRTSNSLLNPTNVWQISRFLMNLYFLLCPIILQSFSYVGETKTKQEVHHWIWSEIRRKQMNLQKKYQNIFV